jgi:hypothetical protein
MLNANQCRLVKRKMTNKSFYIYQKSLKCFTQWRNEHKVKARKEKNNILFFHLAGVCGP